MRQKRMFQNVEYDEQFKRFQAAYPKRSPTMRWSGCYAVWQQAIKSVSPEEMIAGASRYAKYCQQENMINSPYVMLPENFIIEREFENDFVTEVEAHESEWDRAVRVAKTAGLAPFRGAPEETKEQFIARVAAVERKVINLR
jgi:hypothetical protein